jgi:opacity protein-like surface antigen
VGSGTERKTLTGWTIGADIEHAVTDDWTIRGEYRYFAGLDPRITDNTVWASISYKF